MVRGASIVAKENQGEALQHSERGFKVARARNSEGLKKRRETGKRTRNG
jgi:hypothetical protein